MDSLLGLYRCLSRIGMLLALVTTLFGNVRAGDIQGKCVKSLVFRQYVVPNEFAGCSIRLSPTDLIAMTNRMLLGQSMATYLEVEPWGLGSGMPQRDLEYRFTPADMESASSSLTPLLIVGGAIVVGEIIAMFILPERSGSGGYNPNGFPRPPGRP